MAADRPGRGELPAKSSDNAPGRPETGHAGGAGGPEADVVPMVTDEDRTAWAIPYTDLIMLLLVFFVILVIRADPQHTGEGPGEAAGRGNWPESAPTFDIREMPPSGEPGPETTRSRTLESSPDSDVRTAADVWRRRLDSLEGAVDSYLRGRGLAAEVQVTRSQQAVRLRLSDKVLFPTASADGRELLAEIAPLLRRVAGTVEVAGHTDDRPIDTPRYPSNWELSAARAISVVRVLRANGVAETRMEAIGHGANRPVASNTTAAGRARNRRVTIAITPPLPTARASDGN
jgi:chemotaxis protein MotB